jgi:hypothetical protein
MVLPREVDPCDGPGWRAPAGVGAFAVVGLMVVATSVLWTGRSDPPARLASPEGGPAVVTVTDGVVHAGGLHLPRSANDPLTVRRCVRLPCGRCR